MGSDQAFNREVETKHINFDLVGLKNKIDVGIRRAVAFRRFGYLAMQAPLPENFNLGSGTVYSFWPKDLTNDSKLAAAEEFDSWISGSCLKEVDQFFSHFLDQIWLHLELAELHGKRVNSSQLIGDPKFHRKNVPDKLQEVSKRIDAKVDIGCFDSIRRARNALTHGLGLVREVDVNDGKCLRIQWLAPHAFVEDGNEIISMRSDVLDTYKIKSPDGASISIRIEKFDHVFQLGTKIVLSEEHLSEICFFHSQQATLIMKAVQEHLAKLGIAQAKTQS